MASGFVILVLLILPFPSSVKSLDREELLKLYIGVCGFKLCNTSSFTVKPDLDYSLSSNCPNCTCDEDCWLHNRCCPDVYFSFPVFDNVNTSILSTTKVAGKHAYFDMIATCPAGSHSCQEEKTILDSLNSVPVFAGLYRLPFRNACYARCHGYNVTRNWYLDINCGEFYDLNYCSTFNEIEDTLLTSRCNVSYSQNFLSPRLRTTAAVIDTCNVTGLWEVYDPDVDNACRQLGPEISTDSLTHFNVFCYICNPTTSLQTDVVSMCNATGKWNIFDHGLQTACETYPRVQSEHPYKNWFCRVCNQDNADPTTVAMTDGSVSIDYKTVLMDRRPAYQYDVQIRSVDLTEIIDEFRQNTTWKSNIQTALKTKIELILDNNGTTTIDGSEVNITNLLFQYYLRTGSYDVCTTSLLNVSYKKAPNKCSCDVRCLFSDTEICCPDVTLLTHTTCVGEVNVHPDLLELQSHKWLVIDECPPDYDNDVIGTLCHSDNVYTAHQVVPVEDRNGTMVFKNVFCAFCHLKSRKATIGEFIDNISFHTLRIVCPMPIPFRNEISLDSLMNRAHTGRCRQQYIPTKVNVICDKDAVVECNNLTNWSSIDSDLVWACENIHMFPSFERNSSILCDICNPTTGWQLNYTANYNECNMSEQWMIFDSGLDYGCLNYPVIQSMAPVKNALCGRCNFPNWNQRPKPRHPVTGTISSLEDLPLNFPPTVSIRTFFTVNMDTPEPTVRPLSCEGDHVYDVWKKTCRDLVCSHGRHLRDGSCVPLLRNTTNLLYSMSMKLEGRVHHEGIHVTELLESINDTLHEHMTKLLNVRYDTIRVSSILAMTNISCPNRSSVVDGGSGLSILLDFHFRVISEYVDRATTEASLLDLNGEDIELKYAKNTTPFIIIHDSKALRLPLIVKKTDRNRNCYVRKTASASYVPHVSYRRSHVSELLRCTQVYIHADEYVIDDTGMTLTLVGSDVEVHYPNFERVEDWKVRICVKDLPESGPSPAEDVHPLAYPLHIFSVVLVTISMVCLLVAFRAYDKFPYLQTLPGLNTMGLIASLFFVQALFVIQMFTEAEAACTALGMMLHVAWLMYFAWTGVGTFHMYRLFVSDDYQSDDRKRYTVFRHYAIFTAVFSLTIFLLNLILTSAITGGENIGYGGGLCFISTTYGKVLSFIVPVGLVCVWNTVFFIVTFRHIRDVILNTRQQLHNEDHDHGHAIIKIFLKLFVLNGITWLLQVIDGFFEISPFSFIVTLLNASQGVTLLILNRDNIRPKKNKRRPGSKYTGSSNVSDAHRMTISNSNASMSTLQTASYDNPACDSVAEIHKPRNACAQESDYMASANGVVLSSEDMAECESIDGDDSCLNNGLTTPVAVTDSMSSCKAIFRLSDEQPACDNIDENISEISRL